MRSLSSSRSDSEPLVTVRSVVVFGPSVQIIYIEAFGPPLKFWNPSRIEPWD